MVVRFTVLFVTSLIVSLFCTQCAAGGQTADELRKFINRSIEELDSASFKIPQFKSATVDAVEQIRQKHGARYYLCWLKSDEGRVGYIALIDVEGSYQIVSISATTTNPGYFLRHLVAEKQKEKDLCLSRMGEESFVTDVPLVAATPTTFALQPIGLSETACCLTGVLHYLQYEEYPALFDSIGMYGNSGYHWFLRQHSIERNQKNMGQINETLKKIMAEKKKAGWQPFSEELEDALAGEKTEPGDTLEEKVAYRVRVRSIAVPILRRRLLNPATMLERFELIPHEQGQIYRLTHRDTSRGMRDALLIQEDYLKPDTAKLEQGIDVFFRTRGIKAETSFLPFEQMPTDHLPAILVGPGESAGVLLGYIDIDGESFAFIFFPKTGKPRTMTLAEKLRAIRQAHGIAEPDESQDEEFQKALEKLRRAEALLRKVRQEKGLPEPSEEESLEKRMRGGLASLKAAKEKMIVVEDRVGELPGSLEHGVHIVRCSGLASWQGLYIGKIVAGENWGVLPWKSENGMTK